MNGSPHEAPAALRVSVVIPVRNAGSSLERLLDALARQTVGRDAFEVVIADDGSSDGAVDRLSDCGGWLQVSRGPAVNSYAARNRGVDAASASVLAFTDADCLPAPNWLELALDMMRRESLEFVSGRVQPLLPQRPTVWSLMDMRGWQDTEHFLRTGRGVTANLFVSRDLFETVGGFDDSLASNADLDLTERCIAAGARGGFVTELVVHHPTINSGLSFLRKHWFRMAWLAAKDRKEGRIPMRMRPSSMLPWAPALRRRRAGLPLGFDRERCAELGIRITAFDEIRSALLMYGLLSYLTLVAQAWGWWRLRGQDGPLR